MTDLLDAALDIRRLASALDDRAVVLVDGHLLGAAQVADLDLLEFEAQFFHDRLSAGERGDVAEHLLAPVAEARGLDRGDLQDTADLVDHERRERFALDVFRDDEQA